MSYEPPKPPRKKPRRHIVGDYVREEDTHVDSYLRGQGVVQPLGKPFKIINAESVRRDEVREEIRRLLMSGELGDIDTLIQKYNRKFPLADVIIKDVIREMQALDHVYTWDDRYETFFALTLKGRKALGDLASLPPTKGAYLESARAGHEFKQDMMLTGPILPYLCDCPLSGTYLTDVYPPLSGEFIWDVWGMNFVVHEITGAWRVQETKSGREWELPLRKTSTKRMTSKTLKKMGIDKPEEELDDDSKRFKELYAGKAVKDLQFNKSNIVKTILRDVLVPLKHTGQYKLDADQYEGYNSSIINNHRIDYETSPQFALNGSLHQLKEFIRK